MLSIYKDAASALVAVHKNEKEYICLNFPKSKDVIQLSFTSTEMYKEVDKFNMIPISKYCKDQFADNNTHVEEAEKLLNKYMNTKDGSDLLSFMIDFYKSVISCIDID